ncbi:hypothetical protein [Peribacillus muralis]|uniref:hypothetical protein n=1 Tax=Peribacillus muralis TaxID=264697 RepID=UPI003D070226
MYMHHSPRTGIIHTELPYLGMASQVYTGYLEFQKNFEAVPEIENRQSLSAPLDEFE